MRKEMASRDSISSCENYYTDFYSVVRNPQAPPVKKLAPVEDIIESQQELIEKEIIQKIQSKELEAEHQGLALLAKAGKYLFLGIVLPPYLLLYSLPKWVVSEAIPKVVNKISEGVESIKNALAYPFRIFSNPVPKPLQVEKVEEKSGFDLVAMARNGVYSLGQKFFHPFYQATMWLTNGIASGLSFISSSVQQMAGNFVNQVKNTFLEMLARARQGVKSAGNAFHQSFIQPALHWLVGKVDVFMRVTKKIGEWSLRLAKESVRQVARTVRHPIQVSREALAFVGQASRLIARRLKEGVESHVRPILAGVNAIQQTVRRISRKVQDKTDKIKQKMQERAVVVLQQVQQIISSVWFVPYVIQQMTPEWFIRWAQPKMASLKRMGDYAARLGRALVKQASRLGKKIADPLLFAAQKAKRWMGRIRDKAGRSFQGFKDRTKALPKKLNSLRAYGLGQCKMFVKRGFYGIRVVLAWIRVLGRLWMQLVKELAQEISYWFRY